MINFFCALVVGGASPLSFRCCIFAPRIFTFEVSTEVMRQTNMMHQKIRSRSYRSNGLLPCLDVREIQQHCAAPSKAFLILLITLKERIGLAGPFTSKIRRRCATKPSFFIFRDAGMVFLLGTVVSLPVSSAFSLCSVICAFADDCVAILNRSETNST